MAKKDSLVLCAVGDVAAYREEPEAAFKYVASIVRNADIRFAQNERHYSDREDISFLSDDSKLSPKSSGGFTELTTTKNAEALKLCGFDVISFASNHTMDLGPQAMLETVGVLKKLGFAVIGAGKNLKDARKPVIINRNGTRVGFLGYASVLRPGDQAGPDKAGPAPMRAYTLYQQFDYQPGTPPQIVTFPYREDLEAIVDDVKKLRSQVDVLVVSFHWGTHHVHASIATYQKEVAHDVIDAGADMILGHHPHLLKPIEVYKGKPIFYSMGNFALDFQYEGLMEWIKKSPYLAGVLDLYGWKPDPKWTGYAFSEECRKSMIVRCNIEGKKIRRVAFMPVMINELAQPKPVPRKNSKVFNEYLAYMKDICENQKLDTKFSVEGDEIIVSLA